MASVPPVVPPASTSAPLRRRRRARCRPRRPQRLRRRRRPAKSARTPFPSAGLGAPLIGAPTPGKGVNAGPKTPPAQVPSAVDSRRSETYYEVKGTIFGALIEAIDLAQLAKLDADSAREEIRDIVNEIIAIKNIVMSISEQEDLLDDICNDVLGYGPLEPLLARDDIADIMVNGSGTVYIEVAGKIQKTGIRFRDNQQLLNICQRIVSQVGRRVDESSPICDARLPDGSRVNVIVPPLAIDGPALTIRKFKKDKLTLEQLVRYGSISPEGARDPRSHRPLPGQHPDLRRHRLRQDDAAQLPDRATSTTTSASSPARTPPNCNCSSRTWCAWKRGRRTSKARARSPCAIWCSNCLRMRPERIIVGEVRGQEAFDLLQAMNTGHDGSMGTLHANMPREALSRLESMITMGGYSLPSRTIREMICASVDVVVQAARLRDGSRRITHITEVMGMEGDVIITQDIFTYEILGEDANGNLIGQHKSTGIGRPKFWERARYYGEEARLAAALDACRPRARDGARLGHAGLRPLLSGGDRDRRRRVGLHLSLSVRRTACREADGERGALGAGRGAADPCCPEIAARSGRGLAQGARGAAKEGQARAAVDQAHAGRPRLVEAPLHGHRGHARRRRFPGRDAVGRRASAGARLRFRGRLRAAAVAAEVPQEAARGEIPQ